MLKPIITGLMAAMVCSGVAMATCTYPTASWPASPPIANGNLADATQLMANLNYVFGCAAPLASPSFTGNVGIGTTSPAYILDVRRDQNAATVLAVSNHTSGTAAIAGLVVFNDAGNVNQVGIFSTGYPGSGAYAAGDSYVNTGSAGLVLGSSNATGVIKFSTGGTTERMRIDASGNIGIGTSYPLAMLDVYNGWITPQDNVVTNTAGNAGITWYTGSPTSYGIYRTSGTWVTPNYQQLEVAFATGIVIDGGSAYGRSGTVLQPNGGNVGIGNTSPAYLLHAGSSSASGIVAEFQNSSGACTHNPGSSSETVSCSSDARFKSNILDTKDALDWLTDLRVRDFTWNATGERRTGVIAQEVKEKHPEMVHTDSRGYYTVDEPNPWKLIKAVQELTAENHILRATDDNTTRNMAVLTQAMKVQQAEIGKLQTANDSYATKLARFEASDRKYDATFEALTRRLDAMQRKTGAQIADAAETGEQK
jgi:hypothetical protein